jgi:hypothetical protein
MNWSDYLQKEETVVWQGKPAPRCYTFRNWAHSLFGLVLLLSCFVWFYVGINLGSEYHPSVYGWIPVPFLFAGLYLTVGHLLIARLEWESLSYAITSQRLLIYSGLFKKRVSSLSLQDITWFGLKLFSETLGTVSVRAADADQKYVIACIEYPRQMTDFLEAAMVQSGVIPAGSAVRDR